MEKNMHCPYCKAELSGNTQFCPQCGQLVVQIKSTSSNTLSYWSKIEQETAKDDKIRTEEDAARKAQNDHQKIINVGLIALLTVIAILVMFKVFLIPSMHYNRAITLLEQGHYQDAYELFAKHENYKDVDEYLSQFDYYIVSETSKSPSGKITTTNYGYDDSHRLSNKGEVSYKYKNGNLYQEVGSNYVITYTYSNYKGTKLLESEHKEYNSDESFSTTTYKYDNGVLAESSYYEEWYVFDTCMKTRTTEKYHYGSNGLLQKVIDEDEGRETVYSYNSNGQVVSIITTIDGSDWNGEKEFFHYDVVGNLIKREYHNNIRGTVDKYVYTYEYNVWGLQNNSDVSVESSGLADEDPKDTSTEPSTEAQTETPTEVPTEALIEAPTEEIVQTTEEHPFEQQYWIIFTEGTRNNRVEASTITSSLDADELFIIWNGSLTINNNSGASKCNQYYLDENGKWVKMGSYHRLSDRASNVIASNLDIYDKNGKLLVEKCFYQDLDWDLIEKYR